MDHMGSMNEHSCLYPGINDDYHHNHCQIQFEMAKHRLFKREFFSWGEIDGDLSASCLLHCIALSYNGIYIFYKRVILILLHSYCTEHLCIMTESERSARRQRDQFKAAAAFNREAAGDTWPMPLSLPCHILCLTSTPSACFFYLPRHRHLFCHLIHL